jgi:hypothetical protein
MWALEGRTPPRRDANCTILSEARKMLGFHSISYLRHSQEAEKYLGPGT